MTLEFVPNQCMKSISMCRLVLVVDRKQSNPTYLSLEFTREEESRIARL